MERQNMQSVRVAGFEPANEGIKIPCLAAWRYPNVVLVRKRNSKPNAV